MGLTPIDRRFTDKVVALHVAETRPQYRANVRLLETLRDSIRSVILAYDCGDDVAELNSWDRLDSAWNALQVARGRVDPAFLRPQAG